MKIGITDQTEDDFIRDVYSVLITRDDGKCLLWKVPKRLLLRPEIPGIVIEEMEAEMKDYWG